MSDWRASRRRAANVFIKVLNRVLQKPERLTVSQWAERFRILEESTNFSGKWSNDITPYLVGIMDAFNDPYIEEINMVKSTQLGGTEALFNMLGWIIMNDPSPTMLVYPTDDLAKRISTDRLRPSLTKTPEIAERFLPNASKELRLKFQGMNIYLLGSGSPSKLASTSIKYLFFDEIDKMEGASKKEASPYNLAKERVRIYKGDRKIFTCSTPTLKENYVWSLHEAAEAQYEYFVKCPHCGEEILLKWQYIKFPPAGEGLTKEERAAQAVYVCQECGCIITDADKLRMIRKGVWRNTKEGPQKEHYRKVSFWLNALYSRFLTWEDIAREFLNSKDDPDQLQNFVNSWLAEPWEDENYRTTSDAVLERQTDCPQFSVPEWAKLLTGGVDVQQNCLYWTIRAWGPYLTSQNIAHGQALDFGSVEEVMNLFYTKEKTGEQMLVSLCLIDSGYDADSTYEFCASNTDWSLPVKGTSHSMVSNFKLSKVNSVKENTAGMSLVIVDGAKYKDSIAGRLKKPNGRGSWMVYRGCDEDYAQQVTAEHKVNKKTTGGQVQSVWVLKHSHGDNHYLDCEVYAFAAADIMGVRTLHLQESQQIADQLRSGVADPEHRNDQQFAPEEAWIQKNENWI